MTCDTQVRHLLDLFGIAQLYISSLFHEFGVSFEEVDSPAGVFLKVIKLILKHKTETVWKRNRLAADA